MCHFLYILVTRPIYGAFRYAVFPKPLLFVLKIKEGTKCRLCKYFSLIAFS